MTLATVCYDFSSYRCVYKSDIYEHENTSQQYIRKNKQNQTAQT